MWGLPLIVLLAIMGLYLTILLRGLQLRRLRESLRLAVLVRDEPDADGDVSHVQALWLATAGSVGAASILGVTAGLVAGGPGALFWMWIAGFLMMAVQFAEAVLGVRFRETDVRGEKSGGPMQYLAGGLRWGGTGRVLAIVFAAATAVAALGVGNALQVHGISEAVAGVVDLPALLVGGIVALVAGAVILGGIGSVGRVVGVLVPLMLLLYVGAVGWVLVVHGGRLPLVIADVFRGAFGEARAVGGGVAGFAIGQAIAAGMTAGVVTGQGGLGTTGIAAAAARTREPVRQALISMLQAPIAILLVATLAALAILCSDVIGPGVAQEQLLRSAFESALPGAAAAWAFGLATALFAFTSVIAWGYFGERAVQYLAGSRAVLAYRVVYVGAIPVGAVLEAELLWTFASAMHGVMALPNLIGLFLLSGIVVREAKAYAGKSGGRQPSKRL